MKHYVNVSLLFAFAILVASAALRFTQAFSLATTRVHIVFGTLLLTLVLLHLSTRLGYFAKMLTNRKRPQSGPSSIKLLLLPTVTCGYLLAASLLNWWPVPQLVSFGYEARNRAIIFRPDDSVAIRAIDNRSQMKRQSGDTASILVDIEWGSAFDSSDRFPVPFSNARPQIAIWAESSAGALIETFFVSEESAYTETPKWAGTEKRRIEILPIWRRQFTFASGVQPDGEVDTFSTSTPDHSFSIESYLAEDPQGFYICLEVNAPNDPNEYYHSNQSEDADGYSLPGVGQPSLFYSAYIDPDLDKTYYLMEYAGHGGSNSQGGDLYYDSSHITTAYDLVEKILVRVRKQ